MTSLCGAVILALTIVIMSTNITSVMYVHMRMGAAIAYIRDGFDYSSTKFIEGRANKLFDNCGDINVAYFNGYYF